MQPYRNRRHLRLPGNDYRHGAYFITLCAQARQRWFGRIVGTGADAVMEPNALGRIVLDDWHALPGHFPHVRLDQVQLMPDHLHAILVLDLNRLDDTGTQRNGLRVAPTGAGPDVGVRPNGPQRGALGAIIGAFKSGTTYKMNLLNGTPGQRYWQRGYHERCIRRTGGEFERIAQYIAENPAKWR